MFVSIVEGPPYDLELQDADDGAGSMVAVPVAEDGNRVVYVETILSPCTIDTMEHHELVFQITVVSLDDSEPSFTTQLRDVAREYLPAECIPHIMDIVRESCLLLVGSSNPALLYYVTKESHLPEKALQRYYMLTEALQGCGYTIYELGTDAAGRAFWKLAAPFEPTQPND